MSLRHKLLRWLAIALTYSAASTLALSFLPFLKAVTSYVFDRKPLSWPELDVVLSMTELGLIFGFVLGMVICWVVESERKERGIQEPKRRRW
jgi:hypothetical protein